MIIKKYRATKSKFLSLSVKVKGKYQRVNFQQGNKTPMNKFAWFETSDKDLIAGLESDKYFNNLFKIEDVKMVEDSSIVVEEPKVENNGGLLGWICPKCGRCYSPFTSMCSYCCNNMNTITFYDGTFDTPMTKEKAKHDGYYAFC